MIKKSTIWLVPLVGLCFVSCSKNENQSSELKNTDSVAQKIDSVVKVLPELKDSATVKTNSDTIMVSGLEIVEGKYIAKTCENGIFSIVIEGIKKKEPVYKIFDKTKMIAKGNVQVIQDDKSKEINVVMGEIGAMYDNGVLTVQNSGNNMNSFIHFEQCGDKYLNFVKD